MAKTEKIAFILDQVRLCLDRKDLTRALILSKKISPRVFRDHAKKEEAGEIGIEGTAIEAPAEVSASLPLPVACFSGAPLSAQRGTEATRAMDAETLRPT